MKSLSKLLPPLLVLCLASTTPALDYTWSGDGDNTHWTNFDNWDGTGAPITTDDRAIFDRQSENLQSVSLDQNVTTYQAHVRNGDVMLNLERNTLFLGNVLQVGDSADGTGSLHVVNGTLEIDHNRLGLRIGNGSRSSSTMFVSGTNTECKTKYLYLASGTDSTARLIVSNATLRSHTTYFASGSGSFGEVVVTGSNALWGPSASSGPSAQIATGAGEGRILIENGATVNGAIRSLRIAMDPSASGSFTVRGENTTYQSGLSVSLGHSTDMMIRDIVPANGGIGSLNVLDGGTMVGSGTGNFGYFFYVAPQNTLRIRNGNIRWAMSGNRHVPFYFSTNSIYRLELTGESSAYSAANPFIFAGADGTTRDPMARTNYIDGAILDIALMDGYEPTPGEKFYIFRYSGELVGTFKDKPHGSEFYAAHFPFRIDYGDEQRSNDCITLEALPPIRTMIIIR